MQLLYVWPAIYFMATGYQTAPSIEYKIQTHMLNRVKIVRWPSRQPFHLTRIRWSTSIFEPYLSSVSRTARATTELTEEGQAVLWKLSLKCGSFQAVLHTKIGLRSAATM